MRGQETLSFDSGWPCQRIRLAIGCILFFLFEVTIGRQLPGFLTGVILAIGIGCAYSAMHAVRAYKLGAQVAAIRGAVRDRFSSSEA